MKTRHLVYAGDSQSNWRTFLSRSTSSQKCYSAMREMAAGMTVMGDPSLLGVGAARVT